MELIVKDSIRGVVSKIDGRIKEAVKDVIGPKEVLFYGIAEYFLARSDTVRLATLGRKCGRSHELQYMWTEDRLAGGFYHRVLKGEYLDEVKVVQMKLVFWLWRNAINIELDELEEIIVGCLPKEVKVKKIVYDRYQVFCDENYGNRIFDSYKKVEFDAPDGVVYVSIDYEFEKEWRMGSDVYAGGTEDGEPPVTEEGIFGLETDALTGEGDGRVFTVRGALEGQEYEFEVPAGIRTVCIAVENGVALSKINNVDFGYNMLDQFERFGECAEIDGKEYYILYYKGLEPFAGSFGVKIMI
jgi:hypothetical protein